MENIVKVVLTHVASSQNLVVGMRCKLSSDCLLNSL